MSNEDLERKLLKGNLKFRWKVIQDLEKIDMADNFPKFPILFLTCMDPRVDIYRIFQLNPGDVFILKNAGNFLTVDMLRSILIAVHEYSIKYIIILGHLDCGMTKINLTELKEKLYPKSRGLIFQKGNNPYSELRNFFEPFEDVLKNINEQVGTLRDFKGFPSDVKIIGWLYDVHTGWVFETDYIREFESTEEFMKDYREYITMKDLELVDSLESLEKEWIDSKRLIRTHEEDMPSVKIELLKEKESSYESATEYNNHDLFKKNNLSENLLIKGPQITIPKIYVPKIKVNVPNVYKRKKQQNSI